MSSQVLSLAGWTFLPNLVTGWVQSLWYGIYIRAGDPKPQPGSPRYIKHRKRIHIFVISAYLLYSIFEAHYEIRRSSDFYQDLGVPHNAGDREIKSRFRRLAAIHHPDKVAQTANSDEYFRHLKTAQDTLLNPAARFAYDRFGPTMTTWQHCSTISDYINLGITQTLPYYGAGAFFMYVLGLLGYLEFGRYWRWLTLVTLAVLECYMVSRPYLPPFIAKFVNPLITTLSGQPPYLPFQLIELLRKISITIYIAFSQIGPLLASPEVPAKSGNLEEVLQKQIDRLDQTAQAADVEATRLMAMEMAPFVGDNNAIAGLQTKIREWLVQNTIRADPMVRDAISTVLKKRRTDAPAGAKGNR